MNTALTFRKPRYQPSDYVRALVCHYPRRIRERRMLLMLRAYIDDSKQNGVFVLAGYLAGVTKWSEFADDWDLVLAGPPQLHHLKTSDMFRLKARDSVFYGWTPEQVAQRLLDLAKTVNKHILASVQTGIREADFKNIIRGFGGNEALNRPYAFLFYSIIGGIVNRLDDLKIDDRVELFFDTQGNESQEKLRVGFYEAIEMHGGLLKNRISGEPQFKNDEEITPLQAADLMAWHFRRNLVESERGGEWKSDAWTELLNAPRITGLWDRDKLHFLARRIARKHQLGIPLTIPDPSSPLCTSGWWLRSF